MVTEEVFCSDSDQVNASGAYLNVRYHETFS